MLKTPIVDTHLHIWDVDKFDYPWLDKEAYLKRTFTMKDYQKASSKVDIEKIFTSMSKTIEVILDNFSII